MVLHLFAFSSNIQLRSIISFPFVLVLLLLVLLFETQHAVCLPLTSRNFHTRDHMYMQASETLIVETSLDEFVAHSCQPSSSPSASALHLFRKKWKKSWQRCLTCAHSADSSHPRIRYLSPPVHQWSTWATSVLSLGRVGGKQCISVLVES